MVAVEQAGGAQGLKRKQPDAGEEPGETQAPPHPQAQAQQQQEQQEQLQQHMGDPLAGAQMQPVQQEQQQQQQQQEEEQQQEGRQEGEVKAEERQGGEGTGDDVDEEEELLRRQKQVAKKPRKWGGLKQGGAKDNKSTHRRCVQRVRERSQPRMHRCSCRMRAAQARTACTHRMRATKALG